MNRFRALLSTVACLSFLLAACGDDSSGSQECVGAACERADPACGDGVCDNGESCAADCTPAEVCGDAVCGASESFSACPDDCRDQCAYPASPARYLAFDSVAPNMSWEDIFDGGSDRMDFSLGDFMCAADYDRYTSMMIVVGAGWCVACPDYFRYVDSLAEDLDAAGMLVVYVEAEDRDYIPTGHVEANAFVTNLVGGEHGLRIGDADTAPEARQIYNSPNLNAFPAAFAVRRSDMMVITEQRLSDYILPFLEIAQDPDADWSNPGVGNFEPACGPDDEETYEPNDDPRTAPTIELGSFEGGICAPGPDYYRVEIEEDWQIDLEFTHAVGDLDIYAWDFDRNEVNSNIGSDSITDNESFRHYGPATVMVYGYRFASSPYTLTLSEAAPICPEGTDEASEPNNTITDAGEISAGTFTGGICDGERDYFKVGLEGPWRLDLTFSNAIGDLDVYVWDVEADNVLMDGDSPVGSESTDDNESFEHAGPAVVVINGYRGARAPYELTLTDLSVEE